jgi:hypothetical protein
MKQNIIKFFENISNKTNMKINGVDSIPIIYWGELYVTGIKIDDSKNIMVRFKLVKKIDLTTLQGEKTDFYMMNPDAEFWMPYEFLDETTIDEVIQELIDKINELNDYDVLYMEHTDNVNEENVIEGIIFNTKRLACKEAMNYRKIYKNFKMKFIHVGENVKYSNFQAATMALE